MFILKGLKTIFLLIGVLLGKVDIQPIQGLECHACEPCKNGGLGIIQICQVGQTYCAEGEREMEGGHRIGLRTCAYKEWGESDTYVCDKFKPFLQDPKQNVRLCYCQTSLCNKNKLFSSASSFRPGQLLLLLLPLQMLSVFK